VLGIALSLGGATASGSQAGPDNGTHEIVLSGSVASKISYQGRLTDEQGNPLDGDYDLVFQLWDDPQGGGQVGGDVVSNDVPVADGLFTVELLVPQDAIYGQALWLQVTVEGQDLSPRQELLPVPYALSLKPGAQIHGSSQSALQLSSGSEDGVVGETDASDKAGVFGHSAVGTGVRGEGPNSKGVEGVHGRGTAAKGSPGLVVQHAACLPLELRQP